MVKGRSQNTEFGSQEEQRRSKYGKGARREAAWRGVVGAFEKTKPISRASPGNPKHRSLNPKRGKLKKQSQSAAFGRKSEARSAKSEILDSRFRGNDRRNKEWYGGLIVPKNEKTKPIRARCRALAGRSRHQARESWIPHRVRNDREAIDSTQARLSAKMKKQSHEAGRWPEILNTKL